jgi:tetratricopeptide (TPR) repeat protein
MNFRFSRHWVTAAVLLVLTAQLFGQTPNRQEIQAHFQRATEAERAGQNDVAVREFREVLRLDPHSAEAHANLGVIAYREKDYAGASKEFDDARKLRPTLWNAVALLGMSRLRLGDPQQAKPLIEQSLRHLQDTKLQYEASMDLISIDYQQHNLTGVLDVLQVLSSANPKDPGLLYTTYRTYTELAAHTLVTLSQVAPESAEIHRILAQTAENQDDFTHAVAEYRKALELNPVMPGLHFELGQAILESSTGEAARAEAEKEFQQALADDPSDANSHYMLGEIAWLRSNPDGALEHYQKAVQLQPDFVDARIALGKTLTALGRPADAIPQLTEAIRLDPENATPHYRLAQAYRKLGRTDDAARQLAAFKKLHDAQAAMRSLFQELQSGSPRHQTVAPNEAE